MGFLDGLTGNASRVDPAAVAQEYGRLFAQGEQVHAAYQLVRDVFLFTDRRLILLDNGPDFCNPNCDQRSRQATAYERTYSACRKKKQPQPTRQH